MPSMSDRLLFLGCCVELFGLILAPPVSPVKCFARFLMRDSGFNEEWSKLEMVSIGLSHRFFEFGASNRKFRAWNERVVG